TDDDRAVDLRQLRLTGVAVDDTPELGDARRPRNVERDSLLAERDDHEVRRRPVEERMMVRLGERPALAELRLPDERRMPQVADVEERHLRAVRLVPSLVQALADPEQQRVRDRMQIRRVAGKLELSEQRRMRGVMEVDGVERIDLLERDDVAGRPDHPDGVD